MERPGNLMALWFSEGEWLDAFPVFVEWGGINFQGRLIDSLREYHLVRPSLQFAVQPWLVTRQSGLILMAFSRPN